MSAGSLYSKRFKLDKLSVSWQAFKYGEACRLIYLPHVQKCTVRKLASCFTHCCSYNQR